MRIAIQAHRSEAVTCDVDLGLAGAEVSVTRIEALGRQASGKLKRFVPLATG